MKTSLLLIFIFLSAGLCLAGHVVDGVHLTSVKAPWTMRILANDLDLTEVKAKPDQASAYFMMMSESTKLNVSVFIEPVGKCKTGEECRDHVLNAGNPAWGKFEQLAKGKLKDLSYFEFYRPEVQGRPVKMLDMYAEYVSEGYWVDLHISKVLYTKEDHALFEKVVNSVEFVPRDGKTAGAYETQVAGGSSVASSWFGLWGGAKCRESYLALSPLTRKDNSETSWVEYCNKVNSGLGANKFRDLIAAAYTSSLPGKTEQPVAVLAYHSSFANYPSTVEIVGLMRETDGKWTVTNYLPRP